MRRIKVHTSKPETLEQLVARSEMAMQDTRDILDNMRSHAAAISSDEIEMRDGHDRRKR